MLLNSESQKGQNSSSNDSSMKFSNKNKFQSFINYSVKKAKNHSKFYSMSLRNSKKMNSNPRINIIINLIYVKLNFFFSFETNKLIIIIPLTMLIHLHLCILILSVKKRN